MIKIRQEIKKIPNFEGFIIRLEVKWNEPTGFMEKK